MLTALAGMTVRTDLLGVTSMVRALGLRPLYYDRLLDLFHSSALDLDKLTRTWCHLVFQTHPGLLRLKGRPVLVGDGIKVAKAGRQMPAVKRLHQESESNTKPEYIFGHSCQAVAVLAQALWSVFALPLTCRIHEGVVFSNRDQRTLLDKMILLIDSLGIPEPFYFVADAYYATGRIIRGLLAQGNHLVTRVKRNAVAWYPATPLPAGTTRGRGRPKTYGKKIKVSSLLQTVDRLQEVASPLYGEKEVTIQFAVADLLWRAEYEALARQCSQANAPYEDFLQHLTELEVQRRTAVAIERRPKQAEFPMVKELSSYRFAEVPNLTSTEWAIQDSDL